MPIYEQNPIRLQVSMIGVPPVVPIDANTGSQPQFWRGSNISFAIGLFDAMGNPVDISNLVNGQLQLFLFKSAADFVPLASQSLAGSDLYPLITKAGWENGTQQNATFLFSRGDTDQGLDGESQADFWLVVNGVTQNGNVLLYAAGPCTIFNASSALPASSLPTPSYHTQDSSSGNLTITPTSNEHTEVITVSGAARTSKLILTFAGLSAGAWLTVLIEATGANPDIDLELFIGSISGFNPFGFVTDGTTKNAMFRLYFDGATLQPMESLRPAYTLNNRVISIITDNVGNPLTDNLGNPITDN